ncbi:hypothetical protein CRN22_12880 [Vibrio vulnificus]|nr:hypothetical protein CRN22_12880 [Vibrio vulnificus]HAS8133710.1 DUF2971 domain-containing protein [Vibrio vulnificus]
MRHSPLNAALCLWSKSMPFFKYMGFKGAGKFLTDLSIRISPPNDYNDPFELSPEFLAKEHVPDDKKFRNVAFNLNGGVSLIEKYEILDHQIDKYDKAVNVDLVSEISKKIGVACFSFSKIQVPTNILMWAHYSDSHKGIAVKFKDNSKIVNRLTPVVYRNYRPKIDGDFLLSNDVLSLGDLYIKSTHWQYEEEYRLSYAFEDCINVDGNVYVKNIDLDSIESVFIGVNAPENIIELAHKFHQKYKIPVVFTKVSSVDFNFVPYGTLGFTEKQELELEESYFEQ